MSIDLHLHTQASDGTITADELITLAAKEGLTAIAITDHDSTASLQAGAVAAARNNLTFIPGVEISASYSPDVSLHILGYGIDEGNKDLQRVLAENQKAWDKSEEDSIISLQKLDIKIDRERHEYWKTCHQEGGWPLLNVLREMGLVTGVSDYFGKYFGYGKPAYITIEFVSPQEAIAAIKSAGGVPVLAHPGLYFEGVKKLITEPGFLSKITSWGIRGLEAIACGHSEEETNYLLTYCQTHDLLVTGGSDYHGGFVGRTLGLPEVDEAYLSPLLHEIKNLKSLVLAAEPYSR
jgi:predicted metal-dependent phosphoesterase TrpH